MNQCYRYRAFGLRIASELELPELPAASPREGEAEVVIRMGTAPLVRRWATLNEELTVGPGAAFLIRNGREITVDPRPDANPAAVRVVLLGRVMAFLLRQRGWLPLHASAVVIDNECVLFLGAVGAGKSTTAAAFHARGYLVITDDVGAVRITSEGRCIVQAAWPYVRLCDDARAVLGGSVHTATFQFDKHRYDLNHAGTPDNHYPVRCAYMIEYGDAPVVEPIPSLQAIALLSRHSFVRHRNMEREALSRHLRDCSAVARLIPVRRLVRLRSLESLPAVVRLVEEDLAALNDGIRDLSRVSACENERD
jgi:hypothetical protein